MMYTDWQMLMLFRDFAHISIDFSRIFTISKRLGMRLDPCLLHQWKSPSCKLKSPPKSRKSPNRPLGVLSPTLKTTVAFEYNISLKLGIKIKHGPAITTERGSGAITTDVCQSLQCAILLVGSSESLM